MPEETTRSKGGLSVALVAGAAAAAIFLLVKAMYWEAYRTLAFFYPLLLAVVFLLMAICFFWLLAGGIRSRQAKRIVAAVCLLIGYALAIWAGDCIRDRRMLWDFHHNYAKRMEVIGLLQKGQLLQQPYSENGRNTGILPTGYESLSWGGHVGVWTDPATHKLQQVLFYETRGCMGDCESGYVYAVDDHYRKEFDIVTEERHLQEDWYWIEQGQ